MKKMLLILCIAVPCLFGSIPRAHAQEQEIAQLVLDIEKLNQLKQILQEMYDGYKILTEGYNKIVQITSGNYNLHEVFLDGLYLVSPTVRKYGRIADIIDFEAKILSEYKSSFSKIKNSKAFSPEQLDYLAGVYDKVLSGSLQGLDELTVVITAGSLRMSDDERLQAIDRVYGDMKSKLTFIRAFNKENALTAAQRLQAQNQISTLDNLYNK
jgi:hypothetical protein